MRQKYDNPAPLTISLAFDFDLLQAISQCEDPAPGLNPRTKGQTFPSDLIPVKENRKTMKMYNNQPIFDIQQRPIEQNGYLAPKQQISTNYEFKSVRSLNQKNQEIFHQKFLKAVQKKQQKFIKDVYGEQNEQQIDKMRETVRQQHLFKSQSLNNTTLNFKIKKLNKIHPSHSSHRTLSPLKKTPILKNKFKDIESEKKKTMMMRLQSKLFKETIHFANEHKIQQVYETIVKKIARNTSESRRSSLHTNKSGRRTMKKIGNDYVKNIAKVDLLKSIKSTHPIHMKQK